MPTTSSKYFVKAGSHVILDVTIGNGETGWNAAFVGETLVGQGDSLSDVDLGDGAALVDKVLVVSSTAVDVQSASHVVVETDLRGGVPPTLPIVQTAATPPNGAANFLFVVQFAEAGK